MEGHGLTRAVPTLIQIVIPTGLRREQPAYRKNPRADRTPTLPNPKADPRASHGPVFVLPGVRTAMQLNVEKLKNTIQDCNVNFLIGSGMSCPYLQALGNIETLLTEVDAAPIDATRKKVITVSLYKRFFDEVIVKNLDVLSGAASAAPVLQQYKAFLQCLNSVLVKRKVTILSKEINLFTTNVDIFLEKALEDLNLEYNDGFNGRFKPKFSLSNLKVSRFKRSLYYDKTAELPVFNLMKLHGSLSWQMDGTESVLLSITLDHVRQIASKVLPADNLVVVPDGATLTSLTPAAAGKTAGPATDAFLAAYEKLLLIVNPTKEKFRHTLMNQTYYELLRLYSNELEKENTVLFVMGFSFADEHIREITMRAANSNPTLLVYVIAYTSEAKKQIEAALATGLIRNKNIQILGPEQQDDGHGTTVDKFKYNFEEINQRVFEKILRSIEAED
ncbi:MAG TPA: SIR2 family protein [Terriglobales bacterium]